MARIAWALMTKATQTDREEGCRRIRVQAALDAQHHRYGGTTTNARADRNTLLAEGRPTPEAHERIQQMQAAPGTRRTTNVMRLAHTIADLRGDTETSAAHRRAAEPLVHHAP